MGVPMRLPETVTLAQAKVTLTAYRRALDSADGAHAEIDASALKRFDSSLIAVLLGCARAARGRGLEMVLHAPPAQLLELAKLYGVDELLASEPTPSH